jgi:hypothetical protein
MAVDTIRKAIAELECGQALERGRVRKRGAGRRALVDVDLTLLGDLKLLVSAECRGGPELLLRWTSKSVRHLARAL